MLSPTAMLEKVAIGNDAGWALAFYREESGSLASKPFRTITRDDYEGDIAATLPSDLAGGKYRFVVDGLVDDQYKEIASFDAKNPLSVRLYLYWRDANASPTGYLANLAGVGGLVGGLDTAALESALVAELAVTKVTRQTGTKHYETVIEAQERPFRRLAEKRLATALQQTRYLAVVQQLCKDVGVTVEPSGFSGDGALPAPAGDAAPAEQVTGTKGDSYRAVISDIAKSLEHAFRKYGRGMLLIRDGKLLVGPRSIPPDDRPVRELSFTNGLVKSEKGEPDRHPNGTDGDEDDGGAPTREQWKLTLKGRPDLKPGDVVSFHPAAEDVSTTTPSVLGALAGSFLGPLVGADESALASISLYVTSVEHKLGRRAGFTTTVMGMKIADDASDAWDTTPPQGSAPAANATGARGATTSGAGDAAHAIRALSEQVAATLQEADVAEVRGTTTKGTAEPPRQTEKVWRGTAPPDGFPHGGRRLAIRRHEPSALDGVAYATPFAWGKCGLVLPRYPGTRVVLLHRNGQQADPIDVGAVWESGHGPESNPGDWWLILPVGVAESARSSIADSEDPPEEPRDKATSDLIDANGNRVIHVAELTVTVGKGSLKKPGERPDRKSSNEDGITIEHRDGGASIVIDKDGKITISAKGDLELKSEQGNITLTTGSSKQVQVSTGTMDVSVGTEMNVH
jgi:hypothetical protein